MRRLRAILWLVVVSAAIVVLVVPGMYFYAASQLPPLDTEFDLERILRQSIESERRSVQLGMIDQSLVKVDFPRPELGRIPKVVWTAYLAQRGCHTYFQSPREDGWPWVKRLLYSVMSKDLPGDGWCEYVFASTLASRVGVPTGGLPHTVAVHKIHRFLKKDALVAYDLATVNPDEGVFGVEEIARQLFKKKLEDLTLAEVGELSLTIPPNVYWGTVRKCINPSQIRMARDDVLIDMMNLGLVPPFDKKQLQDVKPTCQTLKN